MTSHQCRAGMIQNGQTANERLPFADWNDKAIRAKPSKARVLKVKLPGPFPDRSHSVASLGVSHSENIWVFAAIVKNQRRVACLISSL